MNRTATIIAVIVIAVIAFFAWEWRHSPLFSRLFGSTTEGQLVAEVNYQCNEGKTLHASLYSGTAAPALADPKQPPAPTGSAKVSLSDGRTVELKQTISADGARYANEDESFVFWSKGNGALVLEDNQEKSYIGCIQVADDPGGLPQVYESGSNGFSVRYPAGYAVDEAHAYQALGPGRDIHGVKLTIDPTLATGTNLSPDSYISIEQIPGSEACTGARFLESAAARVLTDGATAYSYASSTSAAAGNRYEEEVFALPGTSPCVAVRYFIHYGAIENYPEGAVREFNRDALTAQFDQIRKTLTIVQ